MVQLPSHKLTNLATTAPYRAACHFVDFFIIMTDKSPGRCLSSETRISDTAPAPRPYSLFRLQWLHIQALGLPDGMIHKLFAISLAVQILAYGNVNEFDRIRPCRRGRRPRWDACPQRHNNDRALHSPQRALSMDLQEVHWGFS